MDETSTPKVIKSLASSSRRQEKEFNDPVCIQLNDGQIAKRGKPKTLIGHEERFDFSIPVEYRRQWEAIEEDFRRHGFHRRYEKTLWKTIYKRNLSMRDWMEVLESFVCASQAHKIDASFLAYMLEGDLNQNKEERKSDNKPYDDDEDDEEIKDSKGFDDHL